MKFTGLGHVECEATFKDSGITFGHPNNVTGLNQLSVFVPTENKNKRVQFFIPMMAGKWLGFSAFFLQ